MSDEGGTPLSKEKAAERDAYLRLVSMKQFYQRAFMNPWGQEVMADLMKFCRANESTMNAEPLVQAALEGRRQVWLRIQEYLQLSPEDLFAIKVGRPLRLGEPEETT
jgi:hypothetical protein